MKGLNSLTSTANSASIGNKWGITTFAFHYAVQLLLFTKVQAISTVNRGHIYSLRTSFWKRQATIITAFVLWCWIMPLLVSLAISREINVKYYAVSTWLVPKHKILFLLTLFFLHFWYESSSCDLMAYIFRSWTFLILTSTRQVQLHSEFKDKDPPDPLMWPHVCIKTRGRTLGMLLWMCWKHWTFLCTGSHLFCRKVLLIQFM